MTALLLGLSIGLAAGVSPGPLLVTVVTSTLRWGFRAGTVVACAPLVTDVLVVGVTLLVLGSLPPSAMDVLGVVGGLLVVGMGVQVLREARTATLQVTAPDGGSSWHSLRQASLVNLVSPHPWVSWATAMGPLTVATWRDGPVGAVALVAGFYAALVGAKVGVAALVARSRRRMGDAGYRRALLGAAALLVVAGVALMVEFFPADLHL